MEVQQRGAARILRETPPPPPMPMPPRVDRPKQISYLSESVCVCVRSKVRFSVDPNSEKPGQIQLPTARARTLSAPDEIERSNAGE